MQFHKKNNEPDSEQRDKVARSIENEFIARIIEKVLLISLHRNTNSEKTTNN